MNLEGNFVSLITSVETEQLTIFHFSGFVEVSYVYVAFGTSPSSLKGNKIILFFYSLVNIRTHLLSR